MSKVDEQQSIVGNGFGNEGAIMRRPRWECSYEQPTKNINSTISEKNRLQQETIRHGHLSIVEEELDDKIHKIPLNTVNSIKETVPNNIIEAKTKSDWLKWKEAYFHELDAIAKEVCQVFEKKDIPKNKTLINSRWVFKKKFNEKGIIGQYKARCVAKGFKKRRN
ncbi:hypothetical protein O181_095867 [Austropuccinia psidii MF-1]|uniref:Reverse transcriptase Ty1/copia-type domain-containing protein n=1 Tax=Austropuccinia psidii MF-1 TaxID=1389203 RepID=A0A9Q3J5M2_9BASI|nr:hypothetical protein [Austropuccinia psidii MF-1]